jgi:prolyl-tRNA synthetase
VGTPAVAVQADTGSMGGKTSHEFVVPHEEGEDTYIACANCDYAANVEAAEFVREGEKPAALAELVKVATPDCKTIADVAAFVGVPTSQTLKAVFYWWSPLGEEGGRNGRFLFILVRGDLDINEVKLSNALGGGQLRPATDDEIRAAGAEPGYASAIGLNAAKEFDQPGVFVLADTSIEAGGNFVVGANDAGYHFTGANYPRDFTVSRMADIAQADRGHNAPTAAAKLKRGAALKWATALSWARATQFADRRYVSWMKTAKQQPIFMGSYGIGLDRLMATDCGTAPRRARHHLARQRGPYQVHLLYWARATP